MNESMDKYCGRFHFAWDMDGDLAVSISDIGLLLKAVFLLPSTALASALHSNDSASTFFEISCASGQVWGGELLSAAAWLMGIGAIRAVLAAIGKR